MYGSTLHIGNKMVKLAQVWCTTSFDRLYSLYSTYDVGDVFCVVYSARLQTVYLGAQNTSIQVRIYSHFLLNGTPRLIHCSGVTYRRKT